MYSLPQEIEVWYIIPAIRKEFSKALTNKGLTLEKAGEILGISKAAVSKYLHKKRASKFVLPADIKKEVEKSAEILIQDEKLAVREILKILKIIKDKRHSCILCKKFNKGIIGKCSCGGER